MLYRNCSESLGLRAVVLHAKFFYIWVNMVLFWTLFTTISFLKNNILKTASICRWQDRLLVRLACLKEVV